MLCFRVTTLFAVSNDHSLSSPQTPISNKVLRNGRKPVMPNVPQGNFSTLLAEDGHPNVPLPRTFRQLSEETVVQPGCITYSDDRILFDAFALSLFVNKKHSTLIFKCQYIFLFRVNFLKIFVLVFSLTSIDFLILRDYNHLYLFIRRTKTGVTFYEYAKEKYH